VALSTPAAVVVDEGILNTGKDAIGVLPVLPGPKNSDVVDRLAAAGMIEEEAAEEAATAILVVVGFVLALFIPGIRPEGAS
jgi:hypothetical protein